MKENILGTEKISKLFISFSIPAIIAMVIAGMQVVIDGVFIAKFVGVNAMASVSIAQPFFQLTIAVGMMISVGSLSFMGRSLGAKDINKTQNIFRTSLIVLIIMAVILTVGGFLFSENIALLLGANDMLLKDASTYIKFISIFVLPMFLVYQFGFSNRLVGKPDLYFKGMILSLIVNIILNYMLVKVMQLGVMGASIATGISNSSALFFVIWPQIDRKNIINIFVGRYDKTTIVPVVYNGASEGIASIAGGIVAYIFNIAFMQVAGEAGVAAFTTINYVALFGTYIMFGIGDGIGPIISYNYGAGSLNRVKKILNLSYIVSTVVGVIIALVLFIFGKSIVTIFAGSNIEVIELAVIGARVYAIAFLINGINIINSAYFTCIGFAKESVIVALSRSLIFIVIGVIILQKAFSINGIWMSVPFAEIITLVITYYLFKKMRAENK